MYLQVFLRNEHMHYDYIAAQFSRRMDWSPRKGASLFPSKAVLTYVCYPSFILCVSIQCGSSCIPTRHLYLTACISGKTCQVCVNHTYETQLLIQLSAFLSVSLSTQFTNIFISEAIHVRYVIMVNVLYVCIIIRLYYIFIREKFVKIIKEHGTAPFQ